MPMTRLVEFLNKNGVPHQVIPHRLAFTARTVAGAAHIPGREMAKTVVVDLDGQHVLAVVPANRRVNLERLRQAAGAYYADLAEEWELAHDFPGCEPGTLPPFGDLFGLDVYVEPHLAEDADITFSAGNHREVVRMAYKDFERLAHPILVPM